MFARPLALIVTFAWLGSVVAQDSSPAAGAGASPTGTPETAQPAPEKEKEKAPPARVVSFEEVDGDKNGAVTEEEFYAHVAAQTFEYYNTNKDTAIQTEEAEKIAPKKKAPAPDATPKPKGEKPDKQTTRTTVPWAKVDADANGSVTLEELQATVKDKKKRFQSIFSLIDTDQSGRISAAEWTKYSDQQASTSGGVPIFRMTF